MCARVVLLRHAFAAILFRGRAMAGSPWNVGGSASSSGAILPAATSSPWPGLCLLCSKPAEECQCFVGPRAELKKAMFRCFDEDSDGILMKHGSSQRPLVSEAEMKNGRQSSNNFAQNTGRTSVMVFHGMPSVGCLTRLQMKVSVALTSS
jgi:hypothetical protein